MADWQDYDPQQSSGNTGWQDYQPLPSPAVEAPIPPSGPAPPSFFDRAVVTGLNVIPPIVGGIIGTAIEPGGGTALGGATGAYFGNQMAQMYENPKETPNPVESIVAGLGGAIPFAGEFPGEGAVASDLARYALRAPLAHAAQGAVINSAVNIPMSLATQGRLPTWGEEAQAGVFGGAMGLGGGLLFGSLPAYNRLRNIGNAGRAAGGLGGSLNGPQQLNLGLEEPTLRQPYLPGSEMTPQQQMEAMMPPSDATQLNLKFGGAKGPSGRFSKAETSFARPGEDQYRLPYDLYADVNTSDQPAFPTPSRPPTPTQSTFSPESAPPNQVQTQQPPVEQAPPIPQAPPIQQPPIQPQAPTNANPDVVVINDPGREVPMYKSMGYVAGGQDSTTGKPIMVRRDALSQLGDSPVKMEPVTKVDNTPGFVDNMLEGGYKLVGKTADSTKYIFQRLVSETEGSLDLGRIQEIWDGLRARLRRPPTEDEMLNETLRETPAQRTFNSSTITDIRQIMRESEQADLPGFEPQPETQLPPRQSYQDMVQGIRDQVMGHEDPNAQLREVYDALTPAEQNTVKESARAGTVPGSNEPSDTGWQAEIAHEDLQLSSQRNPIRNTLEYPGIANAIMAGNRLNNQQLETLRGWLRTGMIGEGSTLIDYANDQLLNDNRPLITAERPLRGTIDQPQQPTIGQRLGEARRRINAGEPAFPPSTIDETRVRDILDGLKGNTGLYGMSLSRDEMLPIVEKAIIEGKDPYTAMQEAVQKVKDIVSPSWMRSTEERAPEMTPTGQQVLPGSEGRVWSTKPGETPLEREVRRTDVSNPELRMQNRADKVIQLTRALSEASQSGNDVAVPIYRAAAKEIKNPTYGSDRSHDPKVQGAYQGQELLARAKRAQLEGDDRAAQMYQEQADMKFRDLAGQLSLDFLQKRYGKSASDLNISAEQAMNFMGRVNPEEASRGISHGFARSILSGVGHGPPGLSVERSPSYGGTEHVQMVYRNPRGEPIGYASGSRSTADPINPNEAQGGISTFVADKRAGLLYGKAAMQIMRKIVELNMAEPDGIYSAHTYKAFQRLPDLIRRDEGFFDLPALIDNAFGVAKNASLVMGKAWEAVKSHLRDFIKDDSGEFRPGEMIDSVKQKMGWGQGTVERPKTAEGKVIKDQHDYNILKELWVAPDAWTTTGDISPTGRQALTMIHTPEYWQSLGKALRAGVSKEVYDKLDQELRSNPIMQRTYDPRTGKWNKSIGETLGLKLFSAGDPIGQRAEGLATRAMETGTVMYKGKEYGIPGVSKAYANTFGIPARFAGRFFTSFLNNLKVTRTQKLLDLGEAMSNEALTTGKARMPGILGGVNPSELPFGIGKYMPDVRLGLSKSYTPEQAVSMNPYINIGRGKEIVDFVNTATGHAPLKTHLVPANFKGAQVNLEPFAKLLGVGLLSPRFLASKIRFMNPSTYIMASPQVRREYLKSAVAAAAAWWTATTLAKQAFPDDVEVNHDITNSDFGKIKIGNNIRLDPGAGFLQLAVAWGRFMSGGYTSSTSNIFHQFGQGYQPETQKSNAERFIVNKFRGVPKFLYDAFNADQRNPFQVGDRTMQLFMPMVAQDFYELWQKDPKLAVALGLPVLSGMGTQVYEKGEAKGKFLSPENDLLYTGQGPLQMFGSQ